MEDDSSKAQSQQSTGVSGAICSASAPSEIESEETKTSEETDGGGVAAAASSSNKANIDSTNTSRELSMPWVKVLSNHLLAEFFQRMPPKLKRQVEMTTQKMANIMKMHGWRKWHSVDVTIPVYPYPPVSVRVNTFDVDVNMTVGENDDDDDVDASELVNCVQLLLRRIRPRRFSLSFGTRAQLKAAQLDADDVQYLLSCTKGLCDLLLHALVKSKKDDVAISKLELNGLFILKPYRFAQVMTTFADTLTHLSIPELQESEIAAIGQCDHLEVLEYDRDCEPKAYDVFPVDRSVKKALKEALEDKTLKGLALNSGFSPLEILDPGRVHHLTRLTVANLGWLSDLPADANLPLLPNLAVFEMDNFFPHNMPDLQNAFPTVQKLERLHITSLRKIIGPEREDLRGFVYDGGPTPGYLSALVRGLADSCYRYRRSLVFTVTTAMADNKDGQGMLAAMMKFDKEFVTSSNLNHYGVTAFDERLYECDATLTPPTMEHPPHITAIDGSRVYKRQFKIDVKPGVHLSVGFEESPEMEGYNP